MRRGRETDARRLCRVLLRPWDVLWPRDGHFEAWETCASVREWRRAAQAAVKSAGSMQGVCAAGAGLQALRSVSVVACGSWKGHPNLYC